MTTVTVGSILSVNEAAWVGEPPSLLNGTVAAGDISSGTLYIGAAGSSNPAEYINLFLVTSTNTVTPFYTNKISAYDPATKRITAPSLSDSYYPSAVGTKWWILKDYPLQRQFQWNRDGLAIPGAVNTMYTAQRADIGKTLTVTETSGQISSSNLGGYDYEVPSVNSTTTSAGVQVTGSISSRLVLQDDIAYLGSFKLPASIQSITQMIRAMSIMPAAHSQNGQQSLIFNSQGNGPEFTEVNIPTLSTGNSFALLPPATVTRTLTDAYGGKWSNAGIGGTGAGQTDPHGFYYDIGAGKSLLGSAGFYTNQVIGAIYRRNTSSESTGTVDGPITIIDPVRGQLISRCHAGSITKIPPDWQSALGGDLIFGTNVLSVVGAASDGPAAISVNSADIDPAMAKVETGAARGGSGNTVQLSLTCAGATTDYYKNWWIYVPSCTSVPSGEPKGVAVRVLSFDASTKTVTIDAPSVGIPAFSFSPVPSAGTQYTLYPFVSGRQLVRYGVYQLDNYPLNERNRIWTANTFVRGMFWPNGTDSLVVVGFGGGDIYTYGIGGLPNQQNGEIHPRLIYNGQASGNGPAPYSSWHADGTGIRFWTYSAQDLQSVYNGSISYDAIKPNAAWSIRIPTYRASPGLDQQGVSGVAYDPSTRRLYVCMTVFGTWAKGAPPSTVGQAVHVFEVTNAVSV